MRSWCWLLISAAAAAAHAAPPARVELSYDILRDGRSVAEVTHELVHDGERYVVTETWKGKGFYALAGTARRTSRGAITDDGLRPREFTDERAGRSTARAIFDWQAHSVTLQHRGEPRTEPMPPDAHDRLAFLFDFAFAPPTDGEVAFSLLDGRGQSRHVYSVQGHEQVETPAGAFAALRLARRTDDELAQIWLAVERSYLPVRILVTDKEGGRYDQVLTRISVE